MRVLSQLCVADVERDALLEAEVHPRQLLANKTSEARDDRPGLQPALASVQD